MLPRLPLTRAEFKAMPIVGMNDPDPAPEVKRWRFQSVDGDWFARGDRTTVEKNGFSFELVSIWRIVIAERGWARPGQPLRRHGGRRDNALARKAYRMRREAENYVYNDIYRSTPCSP